MKTFLGKRISSTSGLYLLSLVFFILGISYISVPLYQLFCQATGFGGTVQTSSLFSQNIENQEPFSNITKQYSLDDSSATTRRITVNFNADVSLQETTNISSSFYFKPTINNMSVFPGDSALTFYLVKNPTKEFIRALST